MFGINAAYSQVFRPGELTLGLMTPFEQTDGMARLEATFEQAALADEFNFAALWTRDVPLMIPQGSDNTVSALDDPFLWLAGLASVTSRIALGTAAIVLPLRHPLHVAKASLSLDRLSGGRFILGLGSGDRPAEFASFGEALEARRDAFRRRWPVLRAALSPGTKARLPLLEATGGYDVMEAPRALEQKLGDRSKPFVQSIQLDLLESPSAPFEPIELGMRTGRHALVEHLHRLKELGVGHVLFNLSSNGRPAQDVIREIGEEVLPRV